MSAVIIQPVGIVPYPQRHNFWRVMQVGIFDWIHEENDTRTRLIVEVGFGSDLTSTPWGVWNILPPFDTDYVQPAIAHDWLYCTHMMPKEYADAFFWELMVCCGTPAWKRELLYHSVLRYGQSSYGSGPERQKFNAHYMLTTTGGARDERY